MGRRWSWCVGASMEYGRYKIATPGLQYAILSPYAGVPYGEIVLIEKEMESSNIYEFQTIFLFHVLTYLQSNQFKLQIHAARINYTPTEKYFSSNNIDDLFKIENLGVVPSITLTDCEHLTWYTLYTCMTKTKVLFLYGNLHAFSHSIVVFEEQVCFSELICIAHNCQKFLHHLGRTHWCWLLSHNPSIKVWQQSLRQWL